MGRPCICCIQISSESVSSGSSGSSGGPSSGSISSASSGSGDIFCGTCCTPLNCSGVDPEDKIECDGVPNYGGRCTCVCSCEDIGGGVLKYNCETPASSDSCPDVNIAACQGYPENICVCPLVDGEECFVEGEVGTNCIIEDNPNNDGRSGFIRGATGTDDTGITGPTFFIEGASGATSEGPNLPLTGSTGTLSGSTAACHWTSPTNISADDGSVASGGSCTSGGYSNYLKSQGHSFNIPTGATIDGIEVRIERQAGGTRHTDRHVQVTNGDGSGGYSATDLANGTDWSNTGVYTYGGPTELWGETWTPAKINSFLFGVAVAVDVTSFFVATTADCDYIDVKVYYTP